MQSLSSHTKHNRWLAIALIGIAIGGLLVAFWFSSEEALKRTQTDMDSACSDVQNAVNSLYPAAELPHQKVTSPDLMRQALADTLMPIDDIRGGFWHNTQGFMGLAFPATDVVGGKSVAQQNVGLIRSAVQRALELKNNVVLVETGAWTATVVAACPEENHHNLGIWLQKDVQQVPSEFTLAVSVLFALIAIIGGVVIVRESLFNRHWHAERDRIVRQAEDASQAVSVTTEIPEIQPLLLLLYQARQQIQAKNRELSQQANKVIMANQKTLIGRIARSMTALALADLKQLERKVGKENTEATQKEVVKLTQLFQSFEKLTGTSDGFDVVSINAEHFLEELSDYHEANSNHKDITITALAEKGLAFDAEPLLMRFAMDYLVRHIMRFVPDKSEIMLQATAQGDQVKIAVIDESNGVKDKSKHLLFHADELAPAEYGLGLKVVRDALRNQNGDISYEKEDKTSRFNVLIPMTKA